MMFGSLDREAAIASPRTRLSKLEELLGDTPAIPPHRGTLCIGHPIDHLQAICRADRAWSATISQLELQQPVS